VNFHSTHLHAAGKEEKERIVCKDSLRHHIIIAHKRFAVSFTDSEKK
jgi:hypothetical protein